LVNKKEHAFLWKPLFSNHNSLDIMQPALSRLIHRTNQTTNMNVIMADCAQFLNAHKELTWEQILKAANCTLSLPTGRLDPRALALFVQAVAFTLPDSEPEEADNLEERPRRRQRLDDDEDDDSIVVPDDHIEYESSSSESSEE
jgi:hypothetical protein